MMCSATRCFSLTDLPKLLFWLFILFNLSACLEKKGLDDLKQFRDEALSSLKPEIEPLPVVRPPGRFKYAAGKAGNPFSLTNVILMKKEILEEQPPLPDENRRREPLERFPLDGLKMVGTLVRDGQVWAVIRAPDQSVHRVTLGHYVGKNSGKVLSVTESQTVLEETVKSPRGRWVKSKASINLEE